MIFKSDESASELNGFLDSGSLIQGELRFDTSFRVDGKVVGKVVSDGNLVVGERGEVEGEIRVGQVFVSGTVRGEVFAQRRVQLAATGRVNAHLHTPRLIIEEGARFDGRCTMSRDSAGETPMEEGSGPKLVRTRGATAGERAARPAMK